MTRLALVVDLIAFLAALAVIIAIVYSVSPN